MSVGSFSLLLLLLLWPGETAAFSFAEEEAKERQVQVQQKGPELVERIPCAAQLRGKRVALMLAERSGHVLHSDQLQLGPLSSALNARLHRLGLLTYTRQELKELIAQAEVDAFLNNDPDAALAAARKLQADYLLKGILTTSSQINPAVGIRELSLQMSLTLSDGQGRTYAEGTVFDEAYSGNDLLGAASSLLDAHADRLLAELFGATCGD